jgi:hypothetical protein
MAGKSSVKRCSVGTHCDSPCFLARYVKENFDLHTLDNLGEEIRQTIHFRTNMKLIPSICNHHKATFTTRFTSFKQSKKCDNPFATHIQSKRPLGGHIVNLVSCITVSSTSKLHFYPGQRLCVNCDNQLKKLVLNNGDEKESLNIEETLNLKNAIQVIIVTIVHKHFTNNIVFFNS